MYLLVVTLVIIIILDIKDTIELNSEKMSCFALELCRNLKLQRLCMLYCDLLPLFVCFVSPTYRSHLASVKL